MSELPSQRSYGLLPTDQLESAYEQASTQYWDALEMVRAADLTKSAIANVLQQRRREQNIT